ncbi:MAG: DUF1573 domain-containing protein [Gemmatales bacterium]|nr:DUF1573 domain-containing protein [Gemmatales bacterium]MCS7159143.1 DUF1573 domain-containing protein [Gemmatales bacterium]MDW8174343.1 DUF1573 domain-containing protein [Gemmatales bacterium]MDW8221435.1 DUF1573 domain-containing protein [Gemmatales bacterium]
MYAIPDGNLSRRRKQCGGCRVLLALLAMMSYAGGIQAELVPVEPTVDFGRVSTLSSPQREVTFHVRGTKPVEILEARGSCGCLQVEVLTPQVAPGRLGRLRLSLYPLRAPAGVHVWEVRIRYREEEQVYEAKWAVRAEVIREITVHPPHVELAVSSEVEQEIVVSDHREQPLQILRVETTSPALSAQLIAGAQEACRPRQYRIRVKVSSELPQPVQDSLLVIHTNDVQCPQLLVPIRVRRLAQTPILIAPSELTIVLAGNEPVSRLVTLRDRQGRPSRISRVEWDPAGIQCSWPQGAFPVNTLRVTVHPGSWSGDSALTELRVYFAEPEACLVRIPVRIQRR